MDIGGERSERDLVLGHGRGDQKRTGEESLDELHGENNSKRLEESKGEWISKNERIADEQTNECQILGIDIWKKPTKLKRTAAMIKRECVCERKKRPRRRQKKHRRKRPGAHITGASQHPSTVI